jgi:hypothetical protein
LSPQYLAHNETGSVFSKRFCYDFQAFEACREKILEACLVSLDIAIILLKLCNIFTPTIFLARQYHIFLAFLLFAFHPFLHPTIKEYYGLFTIVSFGVGATHTTKKTHFLDGFLNTYNT